MFRGPKAYRKGKEYFHVYIEEYRTFNLLKFEIENYAYYLSSCVSNLVKMVWFSLFAKF